MIWRKTITHLARFLTVFIAYVCAIIPAGYMRAWVAKKFGDSTAEDAGFLTFNPFMHIDPVGFIMLALFNVGWGRQVPVNPLNIMGPWRKTKMGIALFSDAIVHFVLASFALVALVSLFDPAILVSTHVSSLSISVAGILVAFIYLNVFLILISLITNAFMLLLMVISQRATQYLPQFYYLILLAPLIVILIFGNQIEQVILLSIDRVAHCLTWLFNIAPKGSL